MKRVLFCILGSMCIGVFVEAGSRAPAQVGAKDFIPVQFASITSSSSVGIYDFLANPKKLEIVDDAEFVVISLIFEKPVSFARMQIESCGGEFKDGINVYTQPSWQTQYIEGGKEVLRIESTPQANPVHVVSINFRHNKKICLQAIRFWDESGTELFPLVSDSLELKVEGDPANYYLFDSRPETPWMGLHETVIPLDFGRAQTIDQIQVWNGLQTSEKGFSATSLAGVLELKTEAGESEVVELAAVGGGQLLRFKKPLKGQKFTLRIRGRGGEVNKNAPIVISELRFGAAEGLVSVEALSAREAVGEKLRRAFADKKLEHVLDRELVVEEEASDWSFRIRSDGSFFVRGQTDENRTARLFFVTGTYQVVGIEKNKIRLALRGVRRPSRHLWDAQVCGIPCGLRLTGTEVSIVDEITLENTKHQRLMIRNRLPARARGLPFSDLKVKASTLMD